MTKRTLKIYKSYSFRNKDPIIDKLRTIIKDEGFSFAKIERKSGVTANTLHNWFNGKTRRPQFATVNAVARCMGYDLGLAKNASYTLNTVRPATVATGANGPKV
jgi:transcriptional regulator with XRE-family HTH domain